MPNCDTPKPYTNANQIAEDMKLKLRFLKGAELSDKELDELQAAEDRLFMIDGNNVVEIILNSKGLFNTHLAFLVSRSY